MSIEAILFDLDDTLLDNSMETFIPAYFNALTEYLADRVAPDRLIGELFRATRAMDDGDGRGLTNEDAFAAAFYPALGQSRAELEPVLARFYDDVFPTLRRLTRPVVDAAAAVEWALQSGRQVVIATNPLFPRTAIEQRLEWAGLSPSRLTFDLVTSYENMHATKARPAYYSEIADRLDRAPSECLMVGDNWRWDVVHAIEAGMWAFWVSDPVVPPPDPNVPLVGHGSISDFLAFARSTWRG